MNLHQVRPLWSPFRHRALRKSPSKSTRPFSSRLRTPLDIPPPFPVTKTCPEPSCACPPTPAMPEGLPIDYDQPLNGTMAAYAQQLLVCTGQRDWTSRIEDDGKEESWGELVRGLRQLLGRRGPFADPFNNILVSTSSLPASSSSSSASAFLFPSFKYFSSIPVDIQPEQKHATNLSTFVQAFLLPEKLHSMQESSLPESKRAQLTRSPDLASQFPAAVDIHHSPVVLICGHGGRDMRCGVMAPALESEFARVLGSRGFSTDSASASASAEENTIDRPDRAHIGLISHVGGHKYAGNVIVYVPPGMTMCDSTPNPLAGKGIWYGRVEPKHVEGIVDETVLGGRVVTDHFRGGIGRNGEILRL